jgi:predicted nucleotidyltransferase
MHQPTDTHRTAKDLSPEELEEYSRRLDEHFKNRKVDEALLQRAWQTAHQVANMLYEDFGATQVAVFGSLAERDWFSKGSDIDIIVWGLSGNTYLDALWETRNFSPEFKIEIVNFDSAKGRFRDRIQSQAIPIQRGETDCSIQTLPTKREEMHDEMNKRELIERIADERRKIERTVEEIKTRLQKMVSASGEDLEDIKDLVAMRLSVFYTGVENIFKRVAKEIDMDEPQGENWHKDLLQQMSTSHPLRPSVISTKTAAALTLILKFRHRLRNIYVFELEIEKTVENAQQVCDIFDGLSIELDVFIAWLKRQESDE